MSDALDRLHDAFPLQSAIGSADPDERALAVGGHRDDTNPGRPRRILLDGTGMDAGAGELLEKCASLVIAPDPSDHACRHVEASQHDRGIRGGTP